MATDRPLRGVNRACTNTSARRNRGNGQAFLVRTGQGNRPVRMCREPGNQAGNRKEVCGAKSPGRRRNVRLLSPRRGPETRRGNGPKLLHVPLPRRRRNGSVLVIE